MINEARFGALQPRIDNFRAEIVEKIVVVTALVLVLYAGVRLVDRDDFPAIFHDKFASDNRLVCAQSKPTVSGLEPQIQSL